MTTLNVTKKEVVVRLESDSSARYAQAKQSSTNANAVVITIGDDNTGEKTSMIVPKSDVVDLQSAVAELGSIDGELLAVGARTFVRQDSDIYRAFVKSAYTGRYVAVNHSESQEGKMVLSIGDSAGNKAAGFIMEREAIEEFIEAIVNELV